MDVLTNGTVYELFSGAAEAYPARPYINVLKETAAVYGISPGEITYEAMSRAVSAKRAAYSAAGYGLGHRVGLLLENRPEVLMHWFALNALGVSVVPINPDLRSAELEYLVSHSEQSLAVAILSRHQILMNAGSKAPQAFDVIGPDDPIPPAPTQASGGVIDIKTEAALLYTSGTTGLPKGCVLTNEYFLSTGHEYRSVGGYCAMDEAVGERMITPLPMFHMNAMACSAIVMLMVGGCLTVLDRFHPTTWWESVRASRASIVHYLGVMPAMLMGAKPSDLDTRHGVRFAMGAGVDKALHGPFETRFGFPLIEAWAMTETGGSNMVIAACDPRHVGTNCFGKPADNVEVRVVDVAGLEVACGDSGELLVRSTAPGNPRYGFFDRYLKNEKETAKVWEDGWFHTGDVVREQNDGSLIFVDRKKNVIRRSGENIAAIEVESVLARHPHIESVAVAATPDDVRGDEVFACIISSTDNVSEAAAHAITAWCLDKLAYYKAPGYIAFVDELPLTSTNKLKRGDLKTLVATLRDSGSVFDCRTLKKRT